MALIARTKTWSTGEILSAADLNAEFDGIVDSLDPTGINDESSDAAEQQAIRDPYDSASRVASLSLEHELQTLRYQIAQLAGTTYWYEDSLGYIWIGAQDMRAGAVNPADGFSTTDDGDALLPLVLDTGTGNEEIQYWNFTGGPTYSEETKANFVFPSNWDLGTVKAKFYWAGTTSCSVDDAVNWQIHLTAYSDSDPLDVTRGTVQAVEDLILVTNGTDMQITSATPAITVGGATLAIGDLINAVFIRTIASGTEMAEDAKLFGVMIQYKKGTQIAAW